MTQEKTIILNKIHAIEKAYYNSENSKKRLYSRLELIQSQISETEKEIVDVINSQETIKDKVSNITQIKGVTITTIAAIIAIARKLLLLNI